MTDNTNPIPLTQVYTMLKVLLVNVETIEQTYNNLCTIDLNLVANTIVPTTYILGDNPMKNIGNKANIRMLQQNQEQNINFINQLKSKIESLIKPETNTPGSTSTEITNNAIKDICNTYRMLKVRIENNYKYFNKIEKETTENLLEISKLITNLSKLNVDEITGCDNLKTTFKNSVEETVDNLKSNPNLLAAKVAYYLYYYLKEDLILLRKGDKTKLDTINTDFNKIIREGATQINRNYDRIREINEIATYASNFIKTLESRY